MSYPTTSAPTSQLPVQLHPGKPPLLPVQAGGRAADWTAAHRDALRHVVLSHGAVLVRGLGLRSHAEVGDVFRAFSGGRLLPERESFAPRTAHQPGVFSSTKWQANQQMCMHHEQSYATDFPGTMMFACLTAPAAGGATAVADSTAVLNALPRDLLARFEREGWMLVRNYNDEIGSSVRRGVRHRRPGRGRALLPDQRDRVRVAARRRAAHPAAALPRSPGTRSPGTSAGSTRSRSSTSGPWSRRCASSWWTPTAATGCRSTPGSGSGAPIGPEIVQLLNSVYEAHTRREPWQAGDLLLVDNIRSAHAREPYEGPREVLVGMTDPVNIAACAPNAGGQQ